MKKWIIILIILLGISLFMLSGCTSSNAEMRNQFTFISNEGSFYVYYHNKTKIMYIVSMGSDNYGTATVMLDTEGKPLLYEGE